MSTRKLGALLSAALGLILVFAMQGQAVAKDRNHDRISDRWERNHHLSLKVNQARRDQDRDGLENRGEFRADFRPHDPDSDNDGVEDGDENAGTIESFNADTGRLVINLFAGDTLSGLVTADTRIKCEDENENENENEAEDRHDGNSGPGRDGGEDNSGSSDEGNSGPGRGDDANCTTADLTQGRVVEEAELEAEDGAAFFDEVELAD
jgi:hypothetical protein